MQWIRVEDQPMPKDGTTFLSLWKGTISLTEHDEEEDIYYISYYPSQYTGSHKVSKEREGKFTHWMELYLPQDY